MVFECGSLSGDLPPVMLFCIHRALALIEDDIRIKHYKYFCSIMYRRLALLN